MKHIWVFNTVKQEMIEAQRQLNADGSMRAVCILSLEALKRALLQKDEMGGLKNAPSLILVDYENAVEQSEQAISMIKQEQSLAGVPLFFMMHDRSAVMDELCYSKGATVVLHKPFSMGEQHRIAHAAWQYQVTKNYEILLQKQASDLRVAKEIARLNEKLKQRNELLYQIFGRYFSDQVVEQIIHNPEGAVIGGEKCEATIMMADLRGFTSISETLEPEVVTDILNHFFEEMLNVINHYHGTVIEYLGDAILAVFGAPLWIEDQHEQAIAAAIGMQNRMESVNAYCAEYGYPMLEMGIGLHGGEVFVGNVGSNRMMRYNVMGQVVNLCSRIESYSVGGQVLASKYLIDQLTCQAKLHNLIEISVKGAKMPIPICEVTGLTGTYACELHKRAEEKMVEVKDRVIFNLYPVEGKMISDQAASATLIYFSRKTAKIMLEDAGEVHLEEFSDVEIFAAKRGGKALFANVYAKITKMEGDEVTLCFTHVNKVFQSFAKKMMESKGE